VTDEFLTVSLYQPNEFISRNWRILMEQSFSACMPWWQAAPSD